MRTAADVDELGIVPGAHFQDSDHRDYRVERVLARSRSSVTSLCVTASRTVVVELWRVESPAARSRAGHRARRLRLGVHPRIPALHAMFFTLPRRGMSVLAAFVFDPPQGVPVRVLFHRLAACAPLAKRFLILEVTRQLFELSAAVEVAGLALPEPTPPCLERLFVSSLGIFVTPYPADDWASSAAEIHDGALAVRTVARCALALVEEFARQPAPSPLQSMAFARLEDVARSDGRATASRDMLTWIHHHVPKYERQRFVDLTTKLAGVTREDTSPTVQGRCPPGASKAPSSLGPMALPSRATGPHSAPRAQLEQTPLGTVHRPGVAGRRVAAVCGAIVATVVASFGVGVVVRDRDDDRKLPVREAAHGVLPLLRSPVLYGSAARKDEAALRCETCVDLSEAPAGRRIFVDGVVRGETPLVLAMPCGKHQLRVGSRSVPRWVDVPCED